MLETDRCVPRRLRRHWPFAILERSQSACPENKGTPHDYQLKLIPLVAPPAPLAPLAPPKKTGSSFFPISVAAHAPSNNDAARAKTAAGQVIPMADKSVILSLVDFFDFQPLRDRRRRKRNAKRALLTGCCSGFLFDQLKRTLFVDQFAFAVRAQSRSGDNQFLSFLGSE